MEETRNNELKIEQLERIMCKKIERYLHPYVNYNEFPPNYIVMQLHTYEHTK